MDHSISRRRFIATTGGAALALAASRAGAQQPALRVRKNIATLNDQSPEIVSMRKAVEKMKALEKSDPSDKRGWRNQAQIHGAILGPFGSCRHASWYFLPWHRAYLYAFEELIREFSGDEQFALPYWDWSREYSLPGPFWGNGNPLNNPPRPGESGSGRKSGLTPSSQIPQSDIDRFVGPNVISQILGISDFETFAGGKVDNLDDMSGFQGRLENAPHNFIHRWVGGDMASGGSPYDAIFWLHHCNIDRLWAEWVRHNPDGTPDDANWLDTVFKGKYGFYDRKGKPLDTISVRKVQTTENLGYRYQDRPIPSKPRLIAGFTPQLFAGPKASKSRLMDRASEFALEPSADEAKRLQDIVDGVAEPLRQTIRMKVSGVSVPKDQDVMLEFFVNCKNLGPDVKITDPSYVASCTFFSHSHEGHEEHEASFLFSLNAAFGRLYGDRPLTANEPLKVGVVARPLFEDGKEAAAPTIQELNPAQVSIEVVAAAA